MTRNAVSAPDDFPHHSSSVSALRTRETDWAVPRAGMEFLSDDRTILVEQRVWRGLRCRTGVERQRHGLQSEAEASGEERSVR